MKDALNNNTGTHICELKKLTEIFPFTIVLYAISIMATLENAAVLYIISRHVALRTSSNILLAGLAAVDFICSSVLTPMVATLAFYYSYSWKLASYHILVFIILLQFSTIILISLDRFLQMYMLNNYRMSVKGSYAALVISWVVPSFFAILLYNVSTKPVRRVSGIVYSSFCILITICLYVGIHVVLVTKSKHMRSSVVIQRTLYNQKRVVRSTFIIITTFCIRNVFIISFQLNPVFFPKNVCVVAMVLVLGVSAVNPWIYYSRIPAINRYIQIYLKRKKRKVFDMSALVYNHNALPFVIRGRIKTS